MKPTTPAEYKIAADIAMGLLLDAIGIMERQRIYLPRTNYEVDGWLLHASRTTSQYFATKEPTS